MSKTILLLFLISLSCHRSQADDAKPKIGNPMQGILVIVLKFTDTMSKEVTNVRSCLLIFGQIFSNSLADMMQDIMVTGYIGPKNIIVFITGHLPKMLGGGKIRHLQDKVVACVNSSDSEGFMHKMTKTVIGCVQSVITKPMEKLDDNMKQLNCELQKVPDALREIGQKKCMQDMAKSVAGNGVKAAKSGGKMGMGFAGVVTSLVIQMPVAGMCIGKNVAIKEPVTVIQDMMNAMSCCMH